MGSVKLLTTGYLLGLLLVVLLMDVGSEARAFPQAYGPDCPDAEEDYDEDDDAFPFQAQQALMQVQARGLFGSGHSGYASGPYAYSSYSGYGAGTQGGYGGGSADPSGRSAQAFGVGYGR